MKLTRDHKAAILTKAINAVFQQRENAIISDENKLAEHAYKCLYPAEVQQKMSALPDEFFPQKSEITVIADGFHQSIKLLSSRKIASIDNQWRRPFYEGSAERVVKLFAKKNRLDKDKKKLANELESFLSGITTTDRLKTMWPDGEEYYKWLTESQKPQFALMVRPDAVNEMILSMKEVS